MPRFQTRTTDYFGAKCAVEEGKVSRQVVFGQEKQNRGGGGV